MGLGWHQPNCGVVSGVVSSVVRRVACGVSPASRPAPQRRDTPKLAERAALTGVFITK